MMYTTNRHNTVGMPSPEENMQAELSKLKHDFETSLIEQEHRVTLVVRNFFRRFGGDEAKRRAAKTAMGHLAFRVAIAGGAGLIAFLSLLVAWRSLGTLQEQTGHFERQTDLIESQTQIMARQNELMELQTSLLDQQNTRFDRQNELIGDQSGLLASQNDLVKEQSYLLESSRRSAIVFELTSILDELDEELDLVPDTQRAPYPVSPRLEARIVALSRSLRPYRYLEGSVLTERLLSPERGQLLITLVASDVDLSRCISECDFSYADLGAANLQGASLGGKPLFLTDESGDFSILTEAGVAIESGELSSINLSMANLRQADLREVDLRNANLTGANLSEANLRGANLRDAMVTSEQLRRAQSLYRVQNLDPGVERELREAGYGSLLDTDQQ